MKPKRFGQTTVGITHGPIREMENGPYMRVSDHKRILREEKQGWARVVDEMESEIDRLRGEIEELHGKVKY